MKEKNEKQLKFYETILDLSHSGIVGVDKDGRIILYNQPAADFLGVPVQQAIGKLVTEVNPDHPGLTRVLSEKSVQLDQLRKLGKRTAIINRAPIYMDDELIGAVSTVRDITELQQYEETMRRKMVQQGLQAKWTLEQMVAKSKSMESLLALAKKYALTDSTVLLQGESGTGKEMLAQGIHRASRRKTGPFVAINCAALPENLLESELFGYEEGSFTGARKGGKPGLFEMAHHGTIFLDEMGELPLVLQGRLLRVLQEKEVMRIGGNKVIPVNVRVIAATNKNLVDQMHEGLFREDLFFRLAILVLKIPPLRQRKEDIPWLIEAFLRNEDKANTLQITEENMQKLQNYSWPGNVRELSNFIERALVLQDTGESIDLLDSHLWINAERQTVQKGNNSLTPAMGETEEEQIQRVLKEEEGNMGRAARRLGIHRTTLWRKLKNMEK
ncbi:sigma 54-interacting transcriptional regulator [Sporosarcina sp. ACRSM]|uniref:sigma-54 interaction domain-containing protein n=1 Tax=Sporosarcina sp. ACRSM TaxID=2918216 RepID=UPI001EF6BDB4|nr:sigma 54-interacting transcriptional regulator [Sporosarcina sp. ACRSM]